MHMYKNEQNTIRINIIKLYTLQHMYTYTLSLHFVYNYDILILVPITW